MRSGVGAVLLGVVLASCAASEGPAPDETPTATTQVEVPESSASMSPTSDASVSATVVPAPSTAVDAGLIVDGLARVMVHDLSLRAAPTTDGERIGLLPRAEPAYVVAGPVQADGYQWYQLASVRRPNVGTCGDAAPEPSLECSVWFGWAAGVTAEGERWLRAAGDDCPTARDTEAYLSLLAAERLACAADDEWRLTAYVAPQTDGRGCSPVYVVDPFWLDASCNLLFLQPEETQYDSFEGLQVFVHPDLGLCAIDADGADCPFEALKGSWIEVTGHLDHSAARECNPILSSTFEEAPYPPPSAEEVIFRCRTQFVVTGVEQN